MATPHRNPQLGPSTTSYPPLDVTIKPDPDNTLSTATTHLPESPSFTAPKPMEVRQASFQHPPSSNEPNIKQLPAKSEKQLERSLRRKETRARRQLQAAQAKLDAAIKDEPDSVLSAVTTHLPPQSSLFTESATMMVRQTPYHSATSIRANIRQPLANSEKHIRLRLRRKAYKERKRQRKALEAETEAALESTIGECKKEKAIDKLPETRKRKAADKPDCTVPVSKRMKKEEATDKPDDDDTSPETRKRKAADKPMDTVPASKRIKKEKGHETLLRLEGIQGKAAAKQDLIIREVPREVRIKVEDDEFTGACLAEKLDDTIPASKQNINQRLADALPDWRRQELKKAAAELDEAVLKVRRARWGDANEIRESRRKKGGDALPEWKRVEMEEAKVELEEAVGKVRRMRRGRGAVRKECVIREVGGEVRIKVEDESMGGGLEEERVEAKLEDTSPESKQSKEKKVNDALPEWVRLEMEKAGVTLDDAAPKIKGKRRGKAAAKKKRGFQKAAGKVVVKAEDERGGLMGSEVDKEGGNGRSEHGFVLASLRSRTGFLVGDGEEM
ncbi:hypothetical protein BJ508DRAFT_307505 [Ascobolus immersus RN42]|uniref:Uncharacterized protein n=1 Tax=Ascobolus immersus RN42 TaxID=1160509 RepID=A0A3N4IF14_ASCIM|nr:hypothetical protein BJ508DRAFT_307505 [Ascobolus immersus RN42]